VDQGRFWPRLARRRRHPDRPAAARRAEPEDSGRWPAPESGQPPASSAPPRRSGCAGRICRRHAFDSGCPVAAARIAPVMRI